MKFDKRLFDKGIFELGLHDGVLNFAIKQLLSSQIWVTMWQKIFLCFCVLRKNTARRCSRVSGRHKNEKKFGGHRSKFWNNCKSLAKTLCRFSIRSYPQLMPIFCDWLSSQKFRSNSLKENFKGFKMNAVSFFNSNRTIFCAIFKKIIYCGFSRNDSFSIFSGINNVVLGEIFLHLFVPR